MASVSSASATGLRTVRVTFSVALTDFTDGTNGALNLANWSFIAQNVSPEPAAAVSPESILEVSSTVVDVTVDDDFSPEQPYQVTAKSQADGGITGVAASPANRAVFSAVALTPPAERSFTTLKMIPPMNLREDSSGDLEKFLLILDDLLGLQMDRVDRWADIFDYENAPENFLDLMLADLAYPFDLDLSEIDKRRLLSVLATMYKLKGTVDGIKSVIRFFLGYECDVLWPDWSMYGGWVLDVSELDYDTVLGSFFYDATLHGSDMAIFTGAQVFSFYVKIGTPSAAALTADEDAKANALIEYMKVAHTHLIDVAAALPPPENVTATAGSGTVTVAWDAVTGADDYAVFVSETPVVNTLSPVGYVDAASPYVDTVPTGEARYYVVCARKAGIDGVGSARVNSEAL